MAPPLPPGFVLDQPAPPAPPPGFVLDQPQQAPERTLLEHAGHKAGLGVQAIGRGIADLLGSPADLATLPFNIGLQTFGREPITEPIGGSESISNLASTIYEGLGGQLQEPENPIESILGEASRFGTSAVAGGGAISGAARAGRITDSTRVLGPVVQAYLKEPGAALVRDLGGGAGAGAAIGAGHEALPEPLQGPIADTILGLMGGAGGAAAVSAPRATGQAIESAYNRVVRDPSVAPDPQMHLRPKLAAVQKASEITQESAVDPRQAAQNIEEGAAFSRENQMPTPTSGLLSNDEGLIALEKRARLQDPVPFQRRDREVRTAAGGQLRSIQPEGPVDAGAATEAARRQIEAQRGAAERGVTTAKTALEGAQQAEQDIGIAAAGRGELAGDASKRLDEAVVAKTMRPMQAEQNRLYAEIPDDIELDATPLVEAARQLRSEAPRGLKGPSLEPFDETAFVVDDQIGSVTSGDLKAMRPRLAKEIEAARARGDFARADALKTIKSTAEGMIDNLPESQAAVEFTKTQMGPKFGQGEGGRLRKEINRGDLARSKTPPTATAGRFLKPGAGGEEVAADLKRILEGSPVAAEGQAAARDYFLSDLAKVVRSDNTIDPRALRTWIGNREGALKAFPEVRAEVDSMLRDVMAKRTTKEGLQRELETKVAGMKRTEQEIQDSALSLILDKDPQKAVASVFASGNPEKAMGEIAGKLSSPEAKKSWKAAVANYLESRTTNTNTGLTLDATDPVSWAKAHRFFKDNTGALSKVFDPEEMQALQRVHRLIEPYTRLGLQATAGSTTAENLVERLRPLEAVLRWKYGHLRTGGIMRSIKMTLSLIPGFSQTTAANRLIERMQFEPELAQHLLTAPVDSRLPAWNAKLRRYLVGAAAGRATQEQDEGE